MKARVLTVMGFASESLALHDYFDFLGDILGYDLE